MSNTPQTKPARYSPLLLGLGIIVIALGFGLPMLTSGSAPQLPSREPTPAPKQAAENAPAPIQPPSATGLGASLLRLIVVLVVGCGLCILIARWMGKKVLATPGTMEVVASIAVAQCVIHLVRAGERRLLIGTDMSGVKAVLELPGPAPELPPVPLPASSASSVSSTDDAMMPLVPASPTLTPPLSQEEILKLLTALRTRPDASSPG